MKLLNNKWCKSSGTSRLYKEVIVSKFDTWDLDYKTPTELQEWANNIVAEISQPAAFRGEPVVAIRIKDDDDYYGDQFMWIGRVYENDAQYKKRKERNKVKKEAEEQLVLEKEYKEYERLHKKFGN